MESKRWPSLPFSAPLYPPTNTDIYIVAQKKHQQNIQIINNITRTATRRASKWIIPWGPALLLQCPAKTEDMSLRSERTCWCPVPLQSRDGASSFSLPQQLLPLLLQQWVGFPNSHHIHGAGMHTGMMLWTFSAATRCSLVASPKTWLHLDDLWVGGCRSRPAVARGAAAGRPSRCHLQA